MKKKLLSILKYLFFFGIGFFLVWWQFHKMTASEKTAFRESLRHANYLLLIPVVIMAILSHISRAMRWKLLMEPMNYHPPVSKTFYSVMIGYLVNTFVPRAGEIARCTILGKSEKIPVNKLIGTVLLERIFDLVCYFFLIVITILLQINFVGEYVKEKIEKINTGNNHTVVKISVVIFLAAALFFLIRFIFRRYAHHHYIIHIKGFHIGLMEGFKTIMHMKKRVAFLAHTFFIWSMYLLQIYVGFSALAETKGLTIVHACSVLSLATLAMIVSPGGIGAFPVAIEEVLKLYDIDNISFGWLIWGTSTAITIVVGLISLCIYLYKNRIHERKQAHS